MPFSYSFYILSALSVISALFVVFSKKPVHSVLYLIFCFFTIAGHYLLLNAQFLFAVHLIVYAGAIMVLFLYTIMFINMNKEMEPHKSNLAKAGAVVAGGVLLLVVMVALKGAETIPLQAATEKNTGMVENLGMVLYNKYALPFEVASVLFLSAMVGAVLLSKKELD
jgi:NADH-quinone oxidoreductase subunit J